VISYLPDLAVRYVGVNDRYLYDGSLRGGAIGAVTGALAGAILAGLMARWYGAIDPERDPQFDDCLRVFVLSCFRDLSG